MVWPFVKYCALGGLITEYVHKVHLSYEIVYIEL